MQCIYTAAKPIAIGDVSDIKTEIQPDNSIEVSWRAPKLNQRLINHYAVRYRALDDPKNMTRVVSYDGKGEFYV